MNDDGTMTLLHDPKFIVYTSHCEVTDFLSEYSDEYCCYQTMHHNMYLTAMLLSLNSVMA